MVYEWIRALINAYKNLQHWNRALFCREVIYRRGLRFCDYNSCLCEYDNCPYTNYGYKEE